jgi:hypothetical protein
MISKPYVSEERLANRKDAPEEPSSDNIRTASPASPLNFVPRRSTPGQHVTRKQMDAERPENQVKQQ